METAAFVLYGILMAGIFEECGRYIIIKYLMKKNKTRDNMIMYGIGHGGIEVWIISMPLVAAYAMIAILNNTLGYETMLATLGITKDVEAMFQPTLDAVAGFGAGSMFLHIFERLCCMFVHIAFTLIVFYAVDRGDKRYLILAVILHAVFDIMPALMQRGIVSMAVTEIWIAACTVLVWIVENKMQKCKDSSA